MSPHTKNAAETPPRFPILRRGLHTHHFILKGFVFFNIGLIVQTDVDIAQDAYQTQFVGKDFASPFEQIGYALVQRLFCATRSSYCFFCSALRYRGNLSISSLIRCSSSNMVEAKLT